MKPKVLVAQPIAEEGTRLLIQQGFEVKQLQGYSVEALQAEIPDWDGLLVRDGKVPREVIERGKKLKVISRHGAGLENIDVAAATEHGIYVTHTPVANSTSVAEHVLGIMLALAKNLMSVDPALRQGNFGIRHICYGLELEGKILSIIGLGNIGRRLGKKAALGLGMKVLGYDPYISPQDLDSAIELTSDWRRIFEEGDFVSLHLPLNDRTRGVVGMKEFQWMKKTAFFINCARAPIVNEKDLVQALEQGSIAGAGIDVYTISPPPQDHPFFKMKNIVVTPHSAAHTHEAMVNMATQAAQGIVEVLTNRTPTWAVNQIRRQ